MATQVQKSIMVNIPVSRVYNQWTQFEEFPHFMNGVKKVTQLSDDRLEWVAEIGGVQRKWEAAIVEQVPDQKVAWAALEGATNAGAVEFEDLGGGQTSIKLTLEYEPEGMVEKVGDKLNIVEKQAEGDLERFKEFIESEEYASGAWRGEIDAGAPVGTPGVEAAAASRGDSGKAGISGKAAAAGAGVAAAGAAAAAAAAATQSSDQDTTERPATPAGPATPTPSTAPAAPAGTTGAGTGTTGAGAGSVAADQTADEETRQAAVDPDAVSEQTGLDDPSVTNRLTDVNRTNPDDRP